jgi:hypothetical protein
MSVCTHYYIESYVYALWAVTYLVHRPSCFLMNTNVENLAFVGFLCEYIYIFIYLYIRSNLQFTAFHRRRKSTKPKLCMPNGLHLA